MKGVKHLLAMRAQHSEDLLLEVSQTYHEEPIKELKINIIIIPNKSDYEKLIQTLGLGAAI